MGINSFRGHGDASRGEERVGRRRVGAVEAADRMAKWVAAAHGREHCSRRSVVRLAHRASGVGEARAALRAGRGVGVKRQGRGRQRLEGRGGVRRVNVPHCKLRGPRFCARRCSRSRRRSVDRRRAASRVRWPRAASREYAGRDDEAGIATTPRSSGSLRSRPATGRGTTALCTGVHVDEVGGASLRRRHRLLVRRGAVAGRGSRASVATVSATSVATHVCKAVPWNSGGKSDGGGYRMATTSGYSGAVAESAVPPKIAPAGAAAPTAAQAPRARASIRGPKAIWSSVRSVVGRLSRTPVESGRGGV